MRKVFEGFSWFMMMGFFSIVECEVEEGGALERRDVRTRGGTSRADGLGASSALARILASLLSCLAFGLPFDVDSQRV